MKDSSASKDIQSGEVEERKKHDYGTRKFRNEMAESKAERLKYALGVLREKVQQLEVRRIDMENKKLGNLAAVKVASELDTTPGGSFDALAETYIESMRLFNDGDSNNAADSVELYEQER